jgi:hypothetical protein
MDLKLPKVIVYSKSTPNALKSTGVLAGKIPYVALL